MLLASTFVFFLKPLSLPAETHTLGWHWPEKSCQGIGKWSILLRKTDTHLVSPRKIRKWCWTFDHPSFVSSRYFFYHHRHHLLTVFLICFWWSSELRETGKDRRHIREGRRENRERTRGREREREQRDETRHAYSLDTCNMYTGITSNLQDTDNRHERERERQKNTKYTKTQRHEDGHFHDRQSCEVFPNIPSRDVVQRSVGVSLVVVVWDFLAMGTSTDPFRACRIALPPHVSQIRRLTTTCPDSTICCQKVWIDQRTRLERFSRKEGVGRLIVRSHLRLLLGKEEKELAMRPILPWNVPIGGRSVQAHTAPRFQAGPEAFPKRPFPHLLQNLGTHTTAGHCNPSDFPREASSQWPASVGVLQAF